MRTRCYDCFRPLAACFCKLIPRVENRTDVLILQHRRERFHAFNTARIARRALGNCHLIADHNRRLAARKLPIHRDAAVLYPSPSAPCLSDLPPAERPSQLVVVDGTWHQAKTLVRDLPQIRDLTRYRLTPAAPGQYRIRREPDAESLSTVEAVVEALRVLEPETAGLDGLLSAFHHMVDDQIARRARQESWRRNRARRARPTHIPRSLTQGLDHLVVAYGEAEPGRPGRRIAHPRPVTWVAERMGSGTRFSAQLVPATPLTAVDLEHMRLSRSEFAGPLSAAAFRQRWSDFICEQDTLVVYHQRTSQLLRNMGASPSRCLVLKSLFRQLSADFQSLEQLLSLVGLSVPDSANISRGHHRLNMAVNLVNHLHRHDHERWLP